MDSSYVGLRTNLRPIGLLAIGPYQLATTAAVGFVAYKTVPEMTVAAGLTLGLNRRAAGCGVRGGDRAVARTARRVMTLLGGESSAERRDRP